MAQAPPASAAHEDVDTCRICSMPGEDGRPLFYPCKCSGTIKYIHQDCLTTWLEHSKKRSCDVCKYRYSFTNVYSKDMPQRLPIHLVAKRVARQLVAAVIIFLRASLVSLIWLAVVPYTTVLTWRTYFWTGDVIAWWINARPKPEPLTPPLGPLAWLGNLTTFLIDADADPAALHVSRETAQLVARTISSDIFTGQIIASMIVLVFLCAFLLREWIMQNARPGLFEEERAAEGAAGLAAAGVAAPLPDPQPQPAPLPAPVPQDQVPPPALNDPPAPAPVEEPLPPRPPTPPPPRPATPLPRSPSDPVPRLVFASPPGEAGPSHPRQRRRSPSPSSSHASSVYPLSESESERGAEDDPPSSSSPTKAWAPKIPLERSSPLREHRKGKASQKDSFDASRDAWKAFQAKREDAARSAALPTSSSASSFEWPALQDAPITPLSASSSSAIPYPLRAAQQGDSAPSSAAGPSALVPYSPATSSPAGMFSPASSSALAPHSAATTSSPVVDLDAARSPIPPFTPSAFQFTVDSPEIPNPFTALQQRVESNGTLWGEPTSAFSPGFPRSDPGSSPFDASAFTPSPFPKRQRMRRPIARTWDSAPSLSAASSSSGAPSPFPPSSAEPVPSSSDAGAGSPIPPFTPSLFSFQGVAPPEDPNRPIAVPGRQFVKRSPLGRPPTPTLPETPGAPDSAAAEKFTFTFAQDQPGSATFSVAAATRRPSLAPATPSEEIPIALYRAPEDLETLDDDEERRKRPRSYTDAEMDRYFRRTDAGMLTDAQQEEMQAQARTAGAPEDDLPVLVDVSDQSDTEFEDHMGHLGIDDDDENEEDWEDMIDGEDALQQLVPEDEAGEEEEEQLAVDEPAPVDPNVDEDLDGALEAVGMRGPVVIVFQNAAIASVLLDLAIAICIWWPYTIGKTLGLITLNPRRGLTLLNMPIRAVRVVSDPIVDLAVYLVVKVFASILLIIPRALRLGLIAVWLLSSRLFIRAGDVLLRIAAFVPGLAAMLPTPGDRARIVRKSDTVVFRILRPDFSALLRRVTALLPATFTNFAPEPEPSIQASIADWLMDVAQKLPIGSDYAQERVRVWNAFVARFTTRWAALVEGDGTVERMLAVALGYFLFMLAAASYLNTFSSANARNAGRAARNAIRQQLVVIKVAMFIVIELILFPVGCGLLLDLCTMSMFPDASIYSRVAFFRHAPLTATFSHWLLGTTFMYQFAIMLSTCRTLMRPGAMWFVKDPQDPAAHPIRDIIDRPATSQIKKLSISVVMYTIVIGVGVGCMVWIMLAVCADLFPLRWNLREPLSDVPIDLLFAHLVLPPTLKYMRIRSTFRAFLEQWWRFTSRQLRLSSFMYGGRYDAEEYTPSKWSLAGMFNGNRPRPEGVARDGGFRRVPANDNVALPKERKTVVRVDEDGNALTPEGAAVIEAQIAEAEEARRDPKLDYTIVYVPPRFGWRMLAFMTFFWMTTVIVVLFGLSFPVRVGRAIIALTTDRILHDVYAFTIGAYALAGGWLIGTELPAAARPWTFIRQILLWAPKAAYMTLMIGFVLPTLLAIALELYLVLPLRMWFFPNTQPVLRIVHCWAVGLILGRIVLRTQRVRRAQRQPLEPVEGEPDDGIMRAWYLIERNGLLAPDVVAATRNFILPVLSGLISTITIPAIAFVVAQKLMPVPIPAKLLPQIVYILIFSLVAGSAVVGNLFDSTSSWMQAVRDQEFLVERRLRNLEARKEAKPAALPAPAPAA
ncbi:hypothetical protein AURDEDRAFT_185325 [Auricularia subglabra TFB-10046 SS5]|nr:hypothetical protein AURDEDRAFT_185325 [Auricularia subglabra TFB-10046 SS5]